MIQAYFRAGNQIFTGGRFTDSICDLLDVTKCPRNRIIWFNGDELHTSRTDLLNDRFGYIAFIRNDDARFKK